MANSTLRLSTLLLCALAAPASGQLGSNLPISLDADSSSLDRRTNRITFQGLRITQGALGIEAESAWATGLDFEDSQWRFEGNVRITIESATINSSEAELRFEANQLKTADLTGTPAIFHDLRTTNGEVIEGEAQHFTYDNGKGTIRMLDDARIAEGGNEIRGCDLIYDVLQEKITVSSEGCGEPVSMTIIPPQQPATEPPDSSAENPE